MDSLDLATALRGFFTTYLLEQRQVSPNTIKSYKDTFQRLFEFLKKEKGGLRRITIKDIEVPLILKFLANLEDKAGRGNSSATRNFRLAAIQSFFKYLSWNYPSLERQAARIRSISRKRASCHSLDFLTRDETKLVFAQVDPRELDGVRDMALLTFLYNTGARSQEASDLRLSWINFTEHTVKIIGKGRRERDVPLWETSLAILKTYINEYRRRPKTPYEDFLFINQHGGRLTRFGVRTIVRKYLFRAKKKCPSLEAKRLSTHSLRHTTASHLLESGVEINVIKSWLGHADLDSTSVYLQSDLRHKKEALARFGPPSNVASSLEQKKKSSADHILDWLKDL